MEQKYKVKEMIGKAMRKNEENIAKQIIENKDRKEMWDNIIRLEGEKKKRDNLKMYIVQGE